MRRSTRITTVLCYLCAIESVLSGIAPPIPAQGRAEYYLLQNDGSYNYGYDTGNGIYAKQAGSKENEVQGSYTYNSNGELINVKYTAGVQGFVPELPGGGLKVVPLTSATAAPLVPVIQTNTGLDGIVVESFRSAPEDNGDKTYSFAYQSDNHERQESSDAAGFVKGRYSYTDETGTHNLEYKAGPDTGFEVIGGSLAQPNGLLMGKQSAVASSKTWTGTPAVLTKTNDNDGSYSFEYNAGDSARQESADAAGNVRGRYSYTNEAGNHDLSYIAGSDTGFQVTGGSLAQPNGLSEEFNLRSAQKWRAAENQGAWTPSGPSPVSAVLVKTPVNSANDGSYSFEYNAGDSSRQESSDTAGNVRGNYAFTNEAGNHDLSYIAGADTGFQVTGGSLATANGLSDAFNANSAAAWRSKPMTKSHVQQSPQISGHSLSGGNIDGSYSFEYQTNDQSRKESSDAGGNVRGAYSFTNDAGTHDLTYVAGPSTGFLVTGGSLAKVAPATATSTFAQKSHIGTTAIHGSGAEQPILGRSIQLRTASGSIGTNWLPVPENYKSGYYFQTNH